MKNRKYKMIEMKKVVQDDGTLVVTEVSAGIPFEVKRLFWVYNVKKGCSRGNHATKKTKLILVAIHGSCKVDVDTGKNKKTFLMDDNTKGLYIDEMIWRSMYDFSEDCVMLAICDSIFDPQNETYDEYEDFIRALKEEDDV